MHTVKFLIHLVQLHQSLAYGVIFLGLLFEGEVILLATGVLAHLGAFNFYFILIFIFAGSLTKIFAGYFLGKLIYQKWKNEKFIKYLEHTVADFLPFFEKKPFWSIFISKFIMGVNYVVIIFAGFKNIKFKTYLKAELLSTIIWAPLLLSLGYFFSYNALHISKEIWKFSLIILLSLFSFIVLDKVLAFIYRVFQEFYDHK